ncbi:hypothetical protein BSKO_03350 [Bryopsis sp. KO-2023]|nr:hypothetical protein BSKO_03350 [Bryopsis sp. KO-2023]
MSVITVQVGQCGNQLGQSLFEELATALNQGSKHFNDQDWLPFFRHSESLSLSNPSKESAPIARSVLIDMEPKVVQSALQRSKNQAWRYPENRSFEEQSGSGNNWGAGFSKHGPRIAGHCLELIRREAECADWLGGMLMVQSVAGGTGAGVGSYLAETIGDEFPSTSMLNYCIWPYSTGEVMVQNYNSILTLSQLSGQSAGTILVENDSLLGICRRQHAIENVTLGDMNRVAARSLAGILLPSSSHPSTGGREAPNRPTRLLIDLVEHLCCHRSFPLLSLWSTPQMPSTSVEFTSFSWTSLIKTLRQDMLGEASLERTHSNDAGNRVRTRGVKSVANFVVLRGKGGREVNLGCLEDPSNAVYPRWNPTPLKVAHHDARLSGYAISGAVLSNSQAALVPVVRSKERAWRMFRSRAFVHQYERYGVEAADFQIAFSMLEDIIASYIAL